MKWKHQNVLLFSPDSFLSSILFFHLYWFFCFVYSHWFVYTFSFFYAFSFVYTNFLSSILTLLSMLVLLLHLYCFFLSSILSFILLSYFLFKLHEEIDLRLTRAKEKSEHCYREERKAACVSCLKWIEQQRGENRREEW